MTLTLVLIPLLSAFIGGLFGRKLGEKGAAFFTTFCIFITSMMAWTLWWNVSIKGQGEIYIDLGTWMEMGLFDISWGFVYDSITTSMLILVTTISCLVHLYSISYMDGDPHRPRFMAYLSLFTFFMIMLVTGDNLVQIFIGWEGVGLCSYLLINFWFTRIEANKSAMQAMIVNRVGDIGLALAMFLIYYFFCALDITTISALTPLFAEETINILGFNFSIMTGITVLLLIGAVGKSAQLGLHTWLPSAMEGPTPVSALIHAATMVTAGVFILIRANFFLEATSTGLIIVAFVGAITALFAATVGMVQNDIKKVIAYSTCSQLGYMVLACGLSNYAGSLYHLINHGFFKALLFLSAGVIIHGLADEQDMRKMGGLRHALPLSYSMMLIGSLSLMGFPFLTGFYSKEGILEYAYSSFSLEGTFGHWLGTIGAGITAYYSFRLIYRTFIIEPNMSQKIFLQAHEGSWFLLFPLLVLSLGSIFFGYIFKDLFIGFGSPLHASSLYPNNSLAIEVELLPLYIKFLPVVLSFAAALFAVLINNNFMSSVFQFKVKFAVLYTFFSNKWHFDQVYNYLFTKPFLAFGFNVSYQILDRGLIEFLGPYGITLFLRNISILMSYFQPGHLYNYGLILLIGLIIFLAPYSFDSNLFELVDIFFLFIVILGCQIYLTTNKTSLFREKDYS